MISCLWWAKGFIMPPAKRKAQLLATIQKNEMIGMVQQTRQHYKRPDGELHNTTMHIQYALFDVGQCNLNVKWTDVACLISTEVELTPPSLSDEYPNELRFVTSFLPSYKLRGEWVKTGNLDLNILSPTRPKPLGKTKPDLINTCLISLILQALVHWFWLGQ